MLRIIQNNSVAGAMGYYSTADYYSEGQELVGQWRGQGAGRLGLSGTIDKVAWDALCDNRDPATGLPLTARRNQERTVGYDFNFHVPKSVSVLYGLTRDDRILEAFQTSVDETMRDVERDMKTRVRVNGKNEERTTGNMAWGEFTHFTSRPVDGIPDPHLHAHCFVFNATFDETENRWKAGQFRELKRDAPFYEATFHSRFARRMEELGLEVERTKAGWELADMPKSVIKTFSRRTAQIEEMAKEAGITNPADKDSLGARTRESKKKDMPFSELQAEWRSRLPVEDQDAINRVAVSIGSPALPEDPTLGKEAVTFAANHCFERNSVVPERTVLAKALKHGVGKTGYQSVESAFRKHDLVFGERDGRKLVTSHDVLTEETRMLKFARDGRGTCSRLGNGPHEFGDAKLNAGQRRAVEHVLNSSDRVIIVNGAAGVGKTTMMREAVSAIESGGSKVFTFAPSANASRGVLAKEGFENADTVARLLVDEKLHAQIKDQVVWIDEAGLIGTKTMGQVFDLADKLDARVILSGDRRQHGSVEHGAALRLLESEAGCVAAEIKEIQRQKGEYKRAVELLSRGRTEKGFQQLDRMGWVKEVPEGERYKALADDYVTTVAAGKSALVVSPTHVEGERITGHIRESLKTIGRLDSHEREFSVLEKRNLTEAERGDAVNYAPGDVLVFQQNARGHSKGERIVAGNGELPLNQASKFQAYRTRKIGIAAGDSVRITQNGKTADGKHRLNNGSQYVVDGFTRQGDIVLNNGWTVGKDFGHLDYGYVVTSHASQGKTVDRVFIGQSSESFPASSREQFYVSVSRARQQATVYTDDKESLLDAVSRSDERLSATELVMDRDYHVRRMQMERFAEMSRARDERMPTREGIEYDR
ncbi:MAG: MobF family relaxase [Tepidisphaeraceae bacterium]|jgi:conjugative relaxase-like TrwC/TraI family protein